MPLSKVPINPTRGRETSPDLLMKYQGMDDVLGSAPIFGGVCSSDYDLGQIRNLKKMLINSSNR